MCGRYAVTTDPVRLAAEIGARNEVPDDDDPTPNYNIAPSTTVLTVVDRHEANDVHQPIDRRVRAMRWGLIPPWSTEPGSGPLLFNARAETAQTKPAFRAAAANKRCLFPMDGWYEWRTGPAGPDGRPVKTPFYMSARDGSRLYMAGLWGAWRSPQARAAGDDTAWISSATMLTTEAVGPHRQIHDRMPLIMPVEHWADWLDPDRPADPALLAPPDTVLAEAIDIREVSTLVNRVANNGPRLLEPIS
ncbi:hypothetical protein GOHSU_40_00380 [Gordonia hirsuta DSM 44140 = NBRC 16056]|uniref:Abasic site processing protein n=1 Tax=Gordonia hirsuta DSM 44140 = NBRC 16056 TaxID=1121927 RepID=L7LC25_9ACTN|nr:SOS response-associated peptidase [Gordonia hirsuta]GAC58454.1 hypothetical protein GOHSU_40_00380 [Gordonia hirsuta DSM 44140 = NBRC 16056]